MNVLGIGGLLNEAAVAVARDGAIVAATEQRKVARHHGSIQLPLEAMEATLGVARLAPEAIDVVSIARPIAAGPESLLNLRVRQRFPNARLVVLDHHLAHAASAFYASGFDNATVLTLDRAGDLRCAARWRSVGRRLELEQESYFPDSLGDLYGRVTEFLGFESRADEHKVQWMSAAGDERFVDLFVSILGFSATGWPTLERSYFDQDRLGFGAFSSRFYQAIGVAEDQDPPAALKPHIARGLQRAIELCVAAMAGSGENLCLAGGVAFNAFLVHALESSGAWKNVYVQPAAGNAGTAIGAAYLGGDPALAQPLRTLALGPSYTAEEVKQVVENCKLSPRFLLTNTELFAAVLAELDEKKIVGWMQGAMEFGPRALGNRSILASPLDPFATENLNAFIKRRESFRKFAAAVPRQFADEYFEFTPNARFLASVARVKPQHRQRFAPALLGEDLIRLQVVEPADNALFHQLLVEAGKHTGLPVLYNTSFNLFGYPLVSSPRDAVRSFYSSGIDVLFAGPFLLRK